MYSFINFNTDTDIGLFVFTTVNNPTNKMIRKLLTAFVILDFPVSMSEISPPSAPIPVDNINSFVLFGLDIITALAAPITICVLPPFYPFSTPI